MFTAQNRFNMITDALKLKNMPSTRYITSPDKVKPPEPDPMKVKEVEAKDKTATAALITAQTGAKREQDKTQIDAAKLEQKNHDTLFKALDHDRTNDRQDLETASRVNTQQREIELAEHTAHREAFIAPGN
jgi:hypothetical protein